MSELEIKFQVPAGARDSLLHAIGSKHLQQVELHARYFDTADRLLGRHQLALRLRREGDQWVQTLKGALPHRLERQEDNVALPGASAEGLQVLPERHAATDVGERLAKLLKAHGRPALSEAFRTDVRRGTRVLEAHGVVVEWALDQGAITAGGRTRPLLELELEVKAGDPAGLYAVAQDWQSRHGLWIDPISKAERGALLQDDQPYARAVKAKPPRFHKGIEGGELLRAIVAACLSQILPNAAELAGGSELPEHVHQLRVGLRRLRTALREFGSTSDGPDPSGQAPIETAFAALGEARDRYVLAQSLRPLLVRAGAPLADPADATGSAMPDEATLIARARDLVRGQAFQAALLQLLAYAHPPRREDRSRPNGAARVDASPASDGVSSEGVDARNDARDHLRRLHRQVTRRAEAFETLDILDQHKVRKRLKRLRYLAEFVAPLFKPRRVETWLNALEPAQDELGRHVDHAMAAQRFAHLATQDPRAWFAAGWLSCGLEGTARDARKSLERFARAAVFW
ncbi:MAG TPA: CYTH and CHAD domain-containing protein [Burkholderiaceae bacterium]|nr:CYTH and CHAD domain-containing protein [Burkholderiaceae bacterium]